MSQGLNIESLHLQTMACLGSNLRPSGCEKTMLTTAHHAIIVVIYPYFTNNVSQRNQKSTGVKLVCGRFVLFSRDT